MQVRQINLHKKLEKFSLMFPFTANLTTRKVDKNEKKNFISTVIYVHNDEKKIAKFIEKKNSELNDNFEAY